MEVRQVLTYECGRFTSGAVQNRHQPRRPMVYLGYDSFSYAS